MDDLISRAAAIEAAIDGADDWDGGYNSERERYIREHMAKVPAVDAVPVVRCKNCKYAQHDVMYHDIWCNGIIRQPEWFCADGKRRDGE